MDMLLAIILQAVQIYNWALIIYILMSWFPAARDSGFGRLLTNICEPFLEPFRKIIPPIGVIDISPIVAILVLRFATKGVVELFSWL